MKINEWYINPRSGEHFQVKIRKMKMYKGFWKCPIQQQQKRDSIVATCAIFTPPFLLKPLFTWETEGQLQSSSLLGHSQPCLQQLLLGWSRQPGTQSSLLQVPKFEPSSAGPPGFAWAGSLILSPSTPMQDTAGCLHWHLKQMPAPHTTCRLWKQVDSY